MNDDELDHADAEVFLAFVAVQELATHLYNSSAQAARYSLANYTSDDAFTKLSVAMQLGSACEWLLRAVLANHSPALLADPQSDVSVIALSDVSAVKALTPTGLRTISVSRVIQRLVIIDDRIKSETRAMRILALRNAAAHMALIEHGALKRGIHDLVMVAEDLHLLLVNQETATYWGSEHSQQVDDMKRQGENDSHVHYRNKITAARRRAEDILGVLDAEQRRAVVDRLEARTPPAGDPMYRQRFACPACGSSAYVFFDKWTDLAEAVMPPVVNPLQPHKMSVPTYITVDGLWCPVCTLELDSYMDDMESIPEFNLSRTEWNLEDMSEFWM